MKLRSFSSKSILSPSRNRDGTCSLSSSLSRRLLRNSGSFKGGAAASPMFPATTGKKRGFDNPEPTSPKVTCIGQVRVKTKKKKLRTSAAARSIHRTPSNNPAGLGLQVSFRKLELSRSGHHSFSNPNHDCLPHRNQRWVHFPGTICESIRTFGADWNCFSHCISSKHDHSHHRSGDGSSCGAVIARWLVAVHDGDGRRDRTSEIELVVGGEDESRRSRRRHIFEGIEFNEEEEEEESGRVSVCIPPKNALLLMRCRSDPLKMAALASRFCGSPVPNDDDKPVEEAAEEASMEEEVKADESMNNVTRDRECFVNANPSPVGDVDVEAVEDGEVDEEIHMEILEEEVEDDDDEGGENRPEVATATVSSLTPNPEDDADSHIDDEEEEEEEKGITQRDEDGVVDEEESGSSLLKLETNVEEEVVDKVPEEETVVEADKAEVEGRDDSVEERSDAKVLPDCLLLMMCEPKLSMEVSKETWICSTDFIRWLPERQRRIVVNNNDKAAASADGVERSGIEHKKKDNKQRSTTNALTAHQARIVQQPPRSSCSFPWQSHAAGKEESMGEMIEQRLQQNAAKPVVLTRCKSEPMRTKVASDGACFWKNSKLEPHRSSASNLNINHLMRVKTTAVPEVGS